MATTAAETAAGVIYFDIPTPTPTPFPVDLFKLQQAYERFLAQNQEYLNNTGVWGVVFIIIVGAMGLALFYMWTHRSQASTQDRVVNTMAQLLEKQDKRFDAIEANNTKEEERRDKEIQDARLQHTESLMTISDAMHRFADNGAQTNKLLGAINERDNAHINVLQQMKTDLAIISTQGSTPVQRLTALVEKIDTEGTAPLMRLQESVNQLMELVQSIHAQITPPGQIITTLTTIQTQLDTVLREKISEAVVEKRKTGPLAKIELQPDGGK